MFKQHIVSKKVHFVFLLLLVFVVASQAVAGEEDNGIQYFKNATGSFSGTLIPDPAGTINTVDKSLLSVQADGKPVSYKSYSVSGGRAKVHGRFNALSEGRHKGTIETFTPSKDLLDKRDVLFIVDNTPPKIELVQPAQARTYQFIPRYFLFLISDEGSGVDATNTEKNTVKVSVINAEVDSYDFITKENQLHLLVELKGDIALYNLANEVSIEVSVQDRAGNIGKYNETFIVKENEEERIDRCYSHTRPKRSIVNFVTPELAYIDDTQMSTIKVSWAFINQDISEYISETKTYEGLNFGFYRTELEKFRDKISGKISVRSDSEYISVASTIGNSSSDITIKQTKLAPAGNQIAFITITVPERLDLPLKGKSCEYIDWLVGGSKGQDWVEEELVRISTIQTNEIRIPVLLNNSAFKIAHHVFQKENKLICQLDGKNVSFVEGNSSWFEVNDGKQWFEKSQTGLSASAVVQEGDIPYTAALSAKNFKFEVGAIPNCTVINNDSTMVCKDSYKVVMDPPMITQFVYDRGNNTISATVSDVGTPLEKLDIQFSVNETKTEFDFNTETGKFTASFNASADAVTKASVKVTDNAQQYITKSVALFGEILDEEETTHGKTTSTTVNHQRPQNTHNSLGIYSDNKDPYRRFGMRSCNTKKQPTTRKTMGSAGYGRSYVQECKSYPRRGICKDGKFLSVEDLIHSDVDMADLLGINHKGEISVLLQNVYTPSCDTYAVDITPPDITNVYYNSETGMFSAAITDHGAALRGMGFQFMSQTRKGGGIRSYPKFEEIISPPLTEHVRAYVFMGKFIIPPTGEKFTLSLRAVDRAGNQTAVSYGIIRPLNPPEVKINLVDVAQANKFIQYGGKNITALLTAQAGDESLISSTTFWIDDQILSPFSESSYLYQWYHTADVDLLNRYGTQLKEGVHTARFQAVDEHGLWSEATLNFPINFLPQIENFKAMPNSIQDIGGPAFTAMIYDFGNDLDLSGITLKIDNQLITPDKFFYDPVSFYFSVDGPMDLSDGVHHVRLAAIDNHGNMAEKSLRIVSGNEIELLKSSSDIRIDEIALWELQNQNGDGQANPGEYVRLFISLFNDSSIDLTECNAHLNAEENQIRVEFAKNIYRDLEHGSSTMALRGFDLQIDSNILENTITSRYDTHFTLDLDCWAGDVAFEGEEYKWALPFVLPVYQPSLPSDISSRVKVEFDRLPYTTSTEKIVVTGIATSTSSSVEQITLFVNGLEIQPTFFDKKNGKFEASIPLVEGSNIIEAHALDQSGALGTSTTVITRNSEVIVRLDRLPRTTSAPTVIVSGTAESSAGRIEQVSLFVNGQSVNTNWNGKNGRFSITISLTPGNNRIEVEAVDSTSAIGRATATVERDSSLQVMLDAISNSTSQASIPVSGTVQSSLPITQVTVRVNGSAMATSYNPGSQRFTATANLAEGSNVITAEATNQAGRSGSDREFITRTVAFVPPSVAITSHADGDLAGTYGSTCSGFNFSGNYNPGSQLLQSLRVIDTDPVYGPFECSVNISGPNTWDADCNRVGWDPSGRDQEIRVILETDGGATTSDQIIVTTGYCS